MKPMKVIRRSRQKRNDTKRIIIFASVVVASVIAIAVLCVVLVKALYVPSYYPTAISEEAVERCAVVDGETSTLEVYEDDMRILTVPEDVDMKNIEFTSSNQDIVRVDAGGRVDALKEGVASVKAKGKGFEGSCEFTVLPKKEEAEPDEITSAITANLEIVEKNSENGDRGLYHITVNRRTNVTTVYTYDDKGNYVVPVRAMVSSCGTGGDDITPTGRFSVYFKERWHPLFGDCYGQYVTGFNNEYLFHSVPYYSASADDLETEEFNKLSINASQGCVRLMVADAKWIYDNCPLDTGVEVVDKDEKHDPLGKPSAIKISAKDSWDPTDPDENNPFLESKPIIDGAKDIEINKNESFDIMSGVSAHDTCGNDVTDKIVAYQNFVPDKAGVFYVTYFIKDALNKSAKETITVTVK